MKKRLILLGLFLVLLFGSLEGLHCAYERVAWRLRPTIEEELRGIEARYEAGPAAPGGVLFVGSSSIRRWDSLAEDMQPLVALNHGFGGSHVSHIVENRELLIDRHRPRAVVIYSGENDLARTSSKTVASVYADYVELLEGLIELDPELRVYCLSIKASPKRPGRWPMMKDLNRRLAAWCREEPRARFLDVAELLLDPRGLPRSDLFLEDRLHLTEAGYALWRERIRGVLLKDLGS